jgi:hypothetical protein
MLDDEMGWARSLEDPLKISNVLSKPQAPMKFRRLKHL